MRCFGAAPIRCHINKGIPLPPTAYHPRRQYSKPCATPLCGPRPPFFLLAARYWFPSLLPHVCLNLACNTFCSTSMRSEGSAHTLATSTPRIAIQAGLVESWTGCTKVCRYRNCHCSAASQLSSSQDREDFRWYDETGRPHSVKACVRLQCLCLLADVYLGRCLCFSSPRHVRG